MEFSHVPVMLSEVIENLNILPSGTYLDCTVGGAGHSTKIAENLSKDGTLIALDRDEDAINASFARLSQFCDVFVVKNDDYNIKIVRKDKPIAIIVKSNFNDFEKVLCNLCIEKVDGILVDLGVSSHQIDTAERGFSFRHDAVLDMRMDRNSLLTAKDIVNNYSESELANIFYKYGEEEFSRSIARNIVKFREKKPLETTFELVNIIENSMPKKVVYSRGGASKKVFQALRIVVNDELSFLETTILSLVKHLKTNGRLCVISFHSLEDRIVKDCYKLLAQKCICPPNIPKCICNHKPDIEILTKKPIVASDDELEHNSRSACAKLRVCKKI